MDSFVAKGYQGFGSFHSDNVEELIRVPDDQYLVPPLPRTVSEARVSTSGSGSAAFGEHMRKHFMLDWTWCFLNHGAFGAPCREVVLESRAWTDYCELQPLRFIDRELFPHMVHALKQAAALVKAPPTCVALVPNATYALNSVIHSVASQLPPSSSAVFMIDIGYGSVKKMLAAGVDVSSGRVVVGTVRFPLTTTDEFVEQIVGLLPLDVGLVVLDHVTSNSGLVLPVRECVLAIREARPGCCILIDGAHGLGAFDLDLPSLGADYYVSNAHKWLGSPRGLGLLYAAPQHAASGKMRAAVISHGSGAGFTSEFIWDGARDYSPALAFPGLLQWWQWAGGLEPSREYCRTLILRAVTLLRKAWNTDTQAPMAFYSHMACIQLPPCCLPPGAARVKPVGDGAKPPLPGDLLDPESWTYSCTSSHGKMLQDALHYGFHVECPVKTLRGATADPTDMRSYVRISAQVYNTLEDYSRLAEVILRIRWKGIEGTATVELDALDEGAGNLLVKA